MQRSSTKFICEYFSARDQQESIVYCKAKITDQWKIVPFGSIRQNGLILVVKLSDQGMSPVVVLFSAVSVIMLLLQYFCIAFVRLDTNMIQYLEFMDRAVRLRQLLNVTVLNQTEEKLYDLLVVLFGNPFIDAMESLSITWFKPDRDEAINITGQVFEVSTVCVPNTDTWSNRNGWKHVQHSFFNDLEAKGYFIRGADRERIKPFNKLYRHTVIPYC